ncbi:metal-dependent transcriptional regulator [Hydrogenoanaerobacterium sp.]|uniref:metal-dependent transcriptional regulator n=1 Tax=Hydrogenoanaerobacterium sp. TaxID=2953763 RepID=UPI00289D0768|nr:metal-dependent transcriptional regulator [Hydrogenoanaerobacterium sp.]
MKIQESGENYLETILILKNKHGAVRSIDIAAEMDFTKPSISRAMSLLRENGYVTMDKSGLIELTESGYAIASNIYERHQLLTKYLIALGVEESVASADACRMEHVISQQTFDKIKEHAHKKEL